MDIRNYMAYAEVRAVLGLSADELPDSQLALNIYGESLFQELLTTSGTLAPDTVARDLSGQYAYLKTLASPTTNQSLLLSYIRTFAIYTVAAAVLDALSLLAPKTISDGKALMTRFSSERTFDSVREVVMAKKFDMERKVKELLGVTIAERTWVSVAAPTTDVVTNAAYE